MQQTSLKEKQEQVRLGGEGNRLGTVQEIEISTYSQTVYTQTGSGHWKWNG